MIKKRGIYLVLLCLFLGISCFGQYHSQIQEYNNKLLFNPSFAGTTFGKRINGTVVSSRSSNTPSYTRIISADYYRPNKKLGIGFTAGATNNAIDSTFSMFGEASFSKFFKHNRNQFIIPAVSFGVSQRARDLGVLLAGRLTDSVRVDASQSTDLSLKAGLILADYNWNIGVSFMLVQEYEIFADTILTGGQQSRIVAHWMKTIDYKHRGLLSQRVYLQPRLIVDYTKARTLVFADTRFQYFRWSGGLAALHNLKNNKTRLAVSAEYDLKRFRLGYMISTQVPTSGYFELMQSLNIRLNIPELNGKREPYYPLIRDI